jgi:hypothetical protein
VFTRAQCCGRDPVMVNRTRRHADDVDLRQLAQHIFDTGERMRDSEVTGARFRGFAVRRAHADYFVQMRQRLECRNVGTHSPALATIRTVGKSRTGYCHFEAARRFDHRQ